MTTPSTARRPANSGFEPAMIAGALDDHVGIGCGDCLGVGGPRETRSAPSVDAICSGTSCTSTAVIDCAPARLSTATTSAPMGPAADDQPPSYRVRLPLAKQRARQRLAGFGYRTQSAGPTPRAVPGAWRVGEHCVFHEGAPRCVGTALHFPGMCSRARGWADRSGTEAAVPHRGVGGVYGHGSSNCRPPFRPPRPSRPCRPPRDRAASVPSESTPPAAPCVPVVQI